MLIIASFLLYFCLFQGLTHRSMSHYPTSPSENLLLSNRVSTSVAIFRYEDPPIKSLRLYTPSYMKISQQFYFSILISLSNPCLDFIFHSLSFFPSALCFWVSSNQLCNFIRNVS